MKIQTILRTMLVMAAIFATASCAKDEGGSAPQGREVVFAAGIAEAEAVPGTRMMNDTWQPNDAIGVFMVTPGGTMPDNLVAVGASSGDNCKYIYDGSKFVPATAADKLYYPHDGSAVDFIAYYPYKPTGPGGVDEYYALSISLTDQSDPSKIDHLWAKATGIAQNKQPVPLQFAHMLCVWELNIEAGDGVDPADLQAMVVTWKGMKHIGLEIDLTHRSLGSQIIGSSDIRAYPAAAGSRYEFITKSGRVYGTTTMEFAVGGETFVWNVPYNVTFQQGKRHPWTITLKKSGLTATPGTITDWGGKDDDPTEGVTGFRYKFGDYYPDPNVKYDPSSPGTVLSGTAAKGVVYWLDPSATGYSDGSSSGGVATGLHGKVVNLKEGASLRWTIDGQTGVTGATDQDDGLANTKAVYDYYSGFGASCPAFAYIGGLNPPGTTYASGRTGVWYMPALNELKALYTAWDGDLPWWEESIMRPIFNGWLTAAGGTGISTGDYWSSTESSATNAWFIDFNTTYPHDRVKTYTYIVRAIMAF